MATKKSNKIIEQKNRAEKIIQITDINQINNSLPEPLTNFKEYTSDIIKNVEIESIFKVPEPKNMNVNKKKIPNKKNEKKLNSIIILKSVCIEDIIKMHFDVNSACEIINNNDTPSNNIGKHILQSNVKKQNFELVGFDECGGICNDVERILSPRSSEWFLDLKKNKIVLWPIMVSDPKNLLLPLKTNYPCRQCHQSFSTSPIGCPLEYNSKVEDWMIEQLKRMVGKVYGCDYIFEKTESPNLAVSTDGTNYSRPELEISKLCSLTYPDLPFQISGYFRTEHSFCSFSCVKSYISSQLSLSPHKSKYENSMSYLIMMYRMVSGKKIMDINIPSSPPLDLLFFYGGCLSLEEYRERIGSATYEFSSSYKKLVMIQTTSFVEEIKV